EQVRDRSAVRTPAEATALLSGGCGQSLRRGAGARLDHEEIAVWHLVDVAIVAVAADEGDLLPVGSPRRRRLVEAAGCQDLGLLCLDVEEIEVIALAAEITAAVGLERVPIDDDGLRRL